MNGTWCCECGGQRDFIYAVFSYRTNLYKLRFRSHTIQAGKIWYIWYMMQASQSEHSVSGLITIFSPKFPTVSPWNISLWPGYGFDSRRKRRRSSKTSVHNICKVAAAVCSHRFMDSITSSPDVFAPGPTLTGNVLYIQQNNRGYSCWWSSKKKIVTVLKCPKMIKTKCFLCAVWDALKFFDQTSFQHSRAVRFFGVMQNDHVGPLFPSHLVTISLIWPTPNWIVSKTNLKDQWFFLSKKIFQVWNRMTKNCTGHGIKVAKFQSDAPQFLTLSWKGFQTWWW